MVEILSRGSVGEREGSFVLFEGFDHEKLRHGEP